jgi:ribosomal protein L24
MYSMTTNTLRVGNKVEVLDGPFKGSTGQIADIQPECSVIRIADGADNIYALIDTVRAVVNPPRKNVLSKRG